MNNKNTINIKIASDVVCPWCYVGKKELEKAMDELKDDYHFEIQFLPFELAPDLPKEGTLFKPYISQKFGSWERYVQSSNFLVERGKTIGINFDFLNIEKSPNTFNIHRIIQFAHQFGLQAKIKEAYMKAYFEETIDLTDEKTVIDIATKNGLDEELVVKLLESDEGSNEIKTLQSSMHSMGISGVPFFIINDQYGLSGAVPSTQLVEALKEVNAKEV